MATIDEINKALANPKLSPRERIRLRESLIKSGVKGTSLHLGAVTPEVEAQLRASARQNKFIEKSSEIRKSKDLAVNTFGRASGNTSGAKGQAQSRANAEEVFRLQKAFTQAKGTEVMKNLQGSQFQVLKQKSSSGNLAGEFIASKGIAVPTFQRELVNELAQENIQGKKVTEQNISRILSTSGFGDVPVSINNGVIDVGTSNEILKPIIEQINGVFSGTGQGTGLDFIPSFPDPTITGGEEGVSDNGLLKYLPYVIIIGVVLVVIFGLKGAKK